MVRCHQWKILAAVTLVASAVTGLAATSQTSTAGVIQAPALPGAPAISSRDRVYTADQSSNTVSVIDPSTNQLLGTIPLGNARPDALLGALYRNEINVHGLGFSPDGSLLAVINVTTNGVTHYRDGDQPYARHSAH